MFAKPSVGSVRVLRGGFASGNGARLVFDALLLRWIVQRPQKQSEKWQTVLQSNATDVENGLTTKPPFAVIAVTSSARNAQRK